jgi:hypothetical protein
MTRKSHVRAVLANLRMNAVGTKKRRRKTKMGKKMRINGENKEKGE